MAARLDRWKGLDGTDASSKGNVAGGGEEKNYEPDRALRFEHNLLTTVDDDMEKIGGVMSRQCERV